MPNSAKGFASMDAEKQRSIAGRGGRRAHELGTAHRWTSETASEAGKIGGKISKRGPSKK